MTATEVRPGWTAEMDALVESHVRLVYYLVNRQAPQLKATGTDIEEASAEGFLALCAAAMDFDPKRGTKFSTFAGVYIVNRVKACARRNSSSVRSAVKTCSIDEHAERLGTTAGNCIADPACAEEAEASRVAIAVDALRRAVDCLRTPYREVMVQRLAGERQGAIAKNMGCTRHQVARLESVAYRFIRRALKAAL